MTATMNNSKKTIKRFCVHVSLTKIMKRADSNLLARKMNEQMKKIYKRTNNNQRTKERKWGKKLEHSTSKHDIKSCHNNSTAKTIQLAIF